MDKVARLGLFYSKDSEEKNPEEKNPCWQRVSTLKTLDQDHFQSASALSFEDRAIIMALHGCGKL